MNALDVPCGNGRHAMELARRGVRMTGIDISGGFLDEARRKAPAIQWIHGDMRQAAWSRPSMRLLRGNSFGYFDHDNCQRFEAVASAMQPGGRFILESGAVSESILAGYAAGADTAHRRSSIFSAGIPTMPSTGRMDITYTFTRGATTGGQADSSVGAFCRSRSSGCFDARD